MSQNRRAIAITAAVSVIVFAVYLVSGLGSGMTPAESLIDAAILSVYMALLLGFGFGMSAWFQRRAVRGKKQAGDTLDVHQQRTVEIDLPYEAAFDLALDALNTLHNQDTYMPVQRLAWMGRLMRNKMKLRIRKTDRQTGTIQAGLRQSTLGMSEFIDSSKIELRLERLDANTTRIHIDSRPGNPLQIYDLGVNLHNVNQLALFLRRQSNPETADSRLALTDEMIETASENLSDFDAAKKHRKQSD